MKKKQLPKQRSAALPKRADATKLSPFDRYFRVLETVAAFPRGLSLTELVTILDFPKTTVHRLLQGLTASGVLVAQNPRFGPYVLGERFIGLLHSSLPDKWTEGLVQPILKELVDKTGDTCFLARLSGASIRSVAMATPENEVHVYVVPGRELSPFYAASAKAILAFQERSVLDAVLAQSAAQPPHSPRTLKKFAEELARIRETDVAYNSGEDIAGYAAVASPIHLQGLGVQYALAVTGTYEKLMSPANKRQLSELTRHFAGRLSLAMGIRLGQSDG